MHTYIHTQTHISCKAQCIHTCTYIHTYIYIYTNNITYDSLLQAMTAQRGRDRASNRFAVRSAQHANRITSIQVQARIHALINVRRNEFLSRHTCKCLHIHAVNVVDV